MKMFKKLILGLSLVTAMNNAGAVVTPEEIDAIAQDFANKGYFTKVQVAKLEELMADEAQVIADLETTPAMNTMIRFHRFGASKVCKEANRQAYVEALNQLLTALSLRNEELEEEQGQQDNMDVDQNQQRALVVYAPIVQPVVQESLYNRLVTFRNALIAGTVLRAAVAVVSHYDEPMPLLAARITGVLAQSAAVEGARRAAQLPVVQGAIQKTQRKASEFSVEARRVAAARAHALMQDPRVQELVEKHVGACHWSVQ